MALSLNEEVKKYSDQLSSGTGGELSSFASTIESGLDGVKGTISAVASGMSTTWKDIVCARSVNLMQTANSKIDNHKKSLDSINSAATAVTSLKEKSDAYVQAYNSYKNSEYYNDNPPENCEDPDAWRAEKTRRENDVKAKEEAALGAADAVRACFTSASGGSSGSGSGGYEITTLSGAELDSFCERNLVRKDRVIVQKTTVDINGAPYEIYYVYDKNLQSRDFENEAFKVYVDDSIQALSKIDGDLLQKMNSTDIIFEQTYACDRGHEMFQMNGIAQAWYWSETHNVTSWFPSFGSSTGEQGNTYNFGVSSIIHEFGHVMDSTLGKSKNGTYDSFETEDPGLANSKWTSIIESESRRFRQLGIEGLCPSYGYEVYKDIHSEYLAEFFYAYNMGYKELLKEECPETYREVERIINETKGIRG